jgi:hypothetical protein
MIFSGITNLHPPSTIHHPLKKGGKNEEWQELPVGDWTANPHRCRYGCADGIRNYQLYGTWARGILNHQLKREGCAEGMALSFWCEKVAKVAKLQVALRFFLFSCTSFPVSSEKNTIFAAEK